MTYVEDWHRHQFDLNTALMSVTDGSYAAVCAMVHVCAENEVPILVMGNGGSASVAEHLSCDFMKGVDAKGLKYPRVHSLVSNQALITAIANDYGYDQIFAKQIEFTNYPKAFVLAISSSGNSKNIVRGLQAAADKNYLCGAMVGFDGGKVVSAMLAAGLTIHVKSYDYGLVEDVHSIIMHSIANSFMKIAP